MSTLTFDQLRQANIARLPQFKNSQGGLAHSLSDGSDWSPADWLQAVIGELGEYANIRKKFQRGDIDFDEYRAAAAKELADVQCYLDIMARRCLDVDHPVRQYVVQDFEGKELSRHCTSRIEAERERLNLQALLSGQDLLIKALPAKHVTETHSTGVDLGQATLNKFNEVSRRVGSTVFLGEEGVRYEGTV